MNAQLQPQSLTTLNQSEMDVLAEAVTGGLRNIQDFYPLTPLQEAMLFHHAIRGEGDIYSCLLLLECKSSSVVDSLAKALQFAIDRHDALRSAVVWHGLRRPLQVVCRSVRLPIERLHLNPGHDFREQMRQSMRQELHRSDLTKAPLMRLQVAEEADGNGKLYALLFFHHLFCDAVSLETLIAELIAYIKNPDIELNEPVQFKTHVVRTLGRPGHQKAEEAFRRMLGDFKRPSIPFKELEDDTNEEALHEVRYQLPANEAMQLRAAARRLRVGAASLFHVACGSVISRTSQLEDVVFGTVFSGRLRSGAATQKTIGMFINTLPLRLNLAEGTAEEIVLRTHRQLLELLSYEDVELTVAHQCSAVLTSQPLFSVLLNYIRRPPRHDSGWNDEETGISMICSRAWTNYPITFIVEEIVDDFIIVCQTKDPTLSQRLLHYLAQATASLVAALEDSSPCVQAKWHGSKSIEREGRLEDMPCGALSQSDTSSEGVGCQATEPPKGATEERLERVWAEILNLDSVGRNQSFFSLGGNSLLGFQLLLKVSERFEVKAPSISIFRCPTVQQMARLLDGLTAAAPKSNSPAPVDIEEGII